MLYAIGFLCLAVFAGAIYQSRFVLDSLNESLESGAFLGKPILTLLMAGIVAAGGGYEPTTQGIISSIWFFIHEGGHFIFCSLIPIGGRLSCAAGGSFIECLYPFFFFVFFAFRGSFSIAAIFLSLFSFSVFSTSRYVGDASQMALPLIVSPEAFLSGGTGEASNHHDWHVIFSSLGILDYAPSLGESLYYLGWFVGGVSLLLLWIADKAILDGCVRKA